MKYELFSMQDFLNSWARRGDDFLTFYAIPYIMATKDMIFQSYGMQGSGKMAWTVAYTDNLYILNTLIGLLKDNHISEDWLLYKATIIAIHITVEAGKYNFETQPYMTMMELLSHIEHGWNVPQEKRNIISQAFSFTYVSATLDFYLIEVLNNGKNEKRLDLIYALMDDKKWKIFNAICELTHEEIWKQIRAQEYTYNELTKVAQPMVVLAIEKLLKKQI